jgi:ribosomal protein S18 acetylase RimI-like enzyme
LDRKETVNPIFVRRLTEADLAAVAQIHADAFPRQKHSAQWVECNARALPRMRYYVAESEARIRGFVLWTEKSGFRDKVVLELEQIAVAPSEQRRGIGEALIRKSLPDIAAQLAERGAALNAVVVSTRADNQAQRLYRNALGAEVEATVRG